MSTLRDAADQYLKAKITSEAEAVEFVNIQNLRRELESKLIVALTFTLIDATPEMGFRTPEHRLEHARKQIVRHRSEIEAIWQAHERKYP